MILILRRVIFVFIVVLGLNLITPTVNAATDNTETINMLETFGRIMQKIKTLYVDEVTDEALIESALSGMLNNLDPHSGYLNQRHFKEITTHAKGEFGGLGIEVTIDKGAVKIISAMDDTPARQAGLKHGDYIIAVDDQSIIGLNLYEAVELMRGPPDTNLKLTVIPENSSEPNTVELTRAIIKVIPVKTSLTENIAYIRVSVFTEQTTDAIKNGFRAIQSKTSKPEGIILDLRDNPGGLLDQAVKVTDLFLDGGEIVSTRGRNKQDNKRYNASSGDIANNIPMIVLINEGSASASEIVAGALKDHKRALILGRKSFGKGSVQTIIPEDGGKTAIRLTTAKYYTPAGHSIQALGINPDIVTDHTRMECKKINDTKIHRSEAALRKHLRNPLKNIDKQNEENTTEQREHYDHDIHKALDIIHGLHVFNGLSEKPPEKDMIKTN